jgi:hypothetical protein
MRRRLSIIWIPLILGNKCHELEKMIVQNFDFLKLKAFRGQ